MTPFAMWPAPQISSPSWTALILTWQDQLHVMLRQIAGIDLAHVFLLWVLRMWIILLKHCLVSAHCFFLTCYYHCSTYCLISTFHVFQRWIFCCVWELQYHIATILVHNGTSGDGYDTGLWYQMFYHSNANGQTRQYGDPDKELLWNIRFIQI